MSKSRWERTQKRKKFRKQADPGPENLLETVKTVRAAHDRIFGKSIYVDRRRRCPNPGDVVVEES